MYPAGVPDNRGFYLLEAKCNETNRASLKVLEKLGFRIEAALNAA